MSTGRFPHAGAGPGVGLVPSTGADLGVGVVPLVLPFRVVDLVALNVSVPDSSMFSCDLSV